MFMAERMFIIIGAFLYGYCLGYYSFDISNIKIENMKLITLFQVAIKNMACSIKIKLKLKLKKKLKSPMTFFLEMVYLMKKFFKQRY